MKSKVNIVPYSAHYGDAFRKLNVEWLEKHFFVEPKDTELLSDPQTSILDNGGYIFYAEYDGEIVGTFALIHDENDCYELGKMAVTEKTQGLGIGNVMLQHCIDFAVSIGAKKIVLLSNTKLSSAIHLYKKYGFVEVPLGNNPYARSNIKMEKILQR